MGVSLTVSEVDAEWIPYPDWLTATEAVNPNALGYLAWSETAVGDGSGGAATITFALTAQYSSRRAFSIIDASQTKSTATGNERATWTVSKIYGSTILIHGWAVDMWAAGNTAIYYPNARDSTPPIGTVYIPGEGSSLSISASLDNPGSGQTSGARLWLEVYGANEGIVR